MRYSVQPMNAGKYREDSLTLEILDMVQKRSDVSQRHVARHLGVALCLANCYLKRCVRKGLIKITEAPANLYLYYLTPKGFAEKSRLTAQYLSYSFQFYRQASESCVRVVDECRHNGYTSLLLCGISDLAEIATLRAMEGQMEVVGYHDRTGTRRSFLNRAVCNEFSGCGDYHACVVTDLLEPQETYQYLLGLVDESRIFVPDVLRLEGHTGGG